MVLYHEYREVVVLLYLDDVLAELLRLLRVHAGRRLVEEQQLRARREGAGNLEPALYAVGQRARDLVLQMVEALLGEELHGLLPHALLLLRVEAKRGGEDVLLGAHVLRDEHVIQHAQRGEEADVLEGARDAELGYLVRRRRYDFVREGVGVNGLGVGDALRGGLVEFGLQRGLFGLVALGGYGLEGLGVVLALVGGGVERAVLAEIFLGHLAARVVADYRLAHELYAPVGGLVDAGHAVEGRRLARAVGAYEGDYLALIHLYREVVDGDDAAELHGDVLHAQDVLTHWRRPPFRYFPRRPFCRRRRGA